MYLVACAMMFAVAFLATSLTITVGYHRGLAHRALALHPITRFIVVKGGIWLTGLDPKIWIVMHRMHHAYADTTRDPHPPNNRGLLGMISQQYVGATRTYRGLRTKERVYMKFASDLNFDIHPLLLRYMWWAPYVLHAIVATVLSINVGWLFAAAYFFGITSHPITGAMVNYFGHSSGHRNFDTRDDSRNNLLAGWFLLGEGFQNNHHRYPRSASFGHRLSEIDLGYVACLGLDAVGLVTINRDRLISKQTSSIT